MKIGAHVSTAGGIVTAFERAEGIGAECIQLFESAPQQWGTARLDDAQVAEFRERMAASGLGPVFIHGKYLMNLASADAKIFKTSASTLRSSLNIAGRIGARGVIFHTGSHKGLGLEAVFEQICDAARRVLDETPEDTWMIFENSAGQGGTIESGDQHERKRRRGRSRSREGSPGLVAHGQGAPPGRMISSRTKKETFRDGSRLIAHSDCSYLDVPAGRAIYAGAPLSRSAFQSIGGSGR